MPRYKCTFNCINAKTGEIYDFSSARRRDNHCIKSCPLRPAITNPAGNQSQSVDALYKIFLEYKFDTDKKINSLRTSLTAANRKIRRLMDRQSVIQMENTLTLFDIFKFDCQCVNYLEENTYLPNYDEIRDQCNNKWFNLPGELLIYFRKTNTCFFFKSRL